MLGWILGKLRQARIQESLATARFERMAVMQDCNKTTMRTGATIPKPILFFELRIRVSLVLVGASYPAGLNSGQFATRWISRKPGHSEVLD